ncbi:MAG: class I SAM-dependent methyltransferase [Flavobacteriaceae bacterium]|nr:class I SAM-dependent methyltransferase [Flavobacteriaceae bacterium]
MIYQLKSYLQFLLKSTNAHGVHSPFVYDFVTQCLYNKKKHEGYTTLKKIRKKHLANTEIIKVIDFGSGSKVFQGNERKIAAIAKNAGVPYKRQQLLFRIATYFQPVTILELGTSVGLGTVALSLGNPSANITTVEGCPNTAKIASALFKDFQLKNIHLQNTTFEDFFKNDTLSYDIIYVDGNHQKEQTLKYFEILSEKIRNDSLIIFDDIYWSSSMSEAWREIIKHPKVTVSIDTFYWGLVFFRKEQKKEHFIIRL